MRSGGLRDSAGSLIPSSSLDGAFSVALVMSASHSTLMETGGKSKSDLFSPDYKMFVLLSVFHSAFHRGACTVDRVPWLIDQKSRRSAGMLLVDPC